MREQAAFAELLRRHEELTQQFARLLHDDAGQVLTSIAMQIGVLEGVAAEEVEQLTGTMEGLLERFREAQAGLGGAVVARRGLAAGLSQLARLRREMQVIGDRGPGWGPGAAQAAFRIVEGLEPRRVVLDGKGLLLEGVSETGEYVEMLAQIGGLLLKKDSRANTIRIEHAD